jgi:2-amino-4-hydroxy-6-hydroxymethyldihydropteridine diphosphokinase
MSEVWLGLGSNVGDKRGNIQRALDRIAGSCRLLALSSIYKTEPVGFQDQDWFLNCAAKVATEQRPRALLEWLKSIEQQLGRTQRIKNGPRTIDLDILLYDDLVVNEDGLAIPHPRMHERLFVLAPLREIAPALLHPVLDATIEALAGSLRDPKRVELYERASRLAEKEANDHELKPADSSAMTNLQEEAERRRSQWQAFHRWEAEQPLEDRTPAEILADLGTIWEWQPASERIRDPDPEKKGIQAMHAALRHLKCNP